MASWADPSAKACCTRAKTSVNVGFSDKLRAQEDGIHEDANHALRFGLPAIGYGKGHRHIVQMAGAVQQRLVDRQNRQKNVAPCVLGKPFDSRPQNVRQEKFHVRSGVANSGRHKPREGQPRTRHSGEFVAPVSEQPFEFRALQGGSLPGCVVGVLHRQFTQRRRQTGSEGFVDLADFAHQHMERPAVKDNVRDGREQRVFAFRQTQ